MQHTTNGPPTDAVAAERMATRGDDRVGVPVEADRTLEVVTLEHRIGRLVRGNHLGR